MANPANFKDTTDSVLGMAKVIDASPTRTHVVDAVGRANRSKIRTAQDGRWRLTLDRDDARAVHAVKDLYSGQRRLLTERMKARQANAPKKVRVRTKDGRIAAVSPENAERLHRIAGVLPVPSYGGHAVVGGPDGMLWGTMAGYWVPTGRCAPGLHVAYIDRPEAEGPQRDPDGNMWEKVEGEWQLVLHAEAEG